MPSASCTRASSRSMKPLAVLATNTSSIVLEQLAQNLAAPERLIGLHFFNPVARMPLIEVIHAERTQPQKVQAGLAFARQIDKLADRLPQLARLPRQPRADAVPERSDARRARKAFRSR